MISIAKPLAATCFGRCVNVTACTESHSCQFGCLDPKLSHCDPDAAKDKAARKRRLAKVRQDSLYILRFVLGENLSADRAIQCLTYLTRLARKAP